MAISRILGRLDSLINMGGGVLATRYEQTGNVVGPDRVDDALFRQWRTSSLAFLNTLPFEYVYRSEFETHCKFSVYDETMEGMAILQAAKDDIEGGYLQKVESLVSASVFSDFLEMSEYLLNNGYKDPTASLVGAVLEDGLRRICNNNGITIKNREDISSLNSKLATKGIYNPLQQKQIQVWNDIRNNADHGNFKEYKENDVRDMLVGVRKFLASYLV
jgi:hypothetical protein